MEVVEVDPFGFITTECLIPATQDDLLSTTPFYREHDFSPAADDADYDGFDDAWPESSDDGGEDGVPLPEDNVVEITFCSVPSTPDNQDDVVPSHSDELGLCVEGNAISKLNDVVSANSDELEELCTPQPSVNDVVSGNSDELEGLCVKRDESSVTPPVSVKNPRFFDLNDVVCGSTEKLGFVTPLPSTKNDLNDVVCGESDELGFSVGGKRTREESPVTPPRAKKKLRFCDDAENITGVANDVVCENTERLGLRCCENTEGISNDVVCESTGDLGLRFCDGDKIDVENTEEMVNDVVCEDFDDLGFCSEERRAKENSLTPPTENDKEVTNDVVFENSIDLGFQGERNTTSDGDGAGAGADSENTKGVLNDVVSGKIVDLGEKVITNEKFTANSPSTMKELRSPELDGAEMAVEGENTEENRAEMAVEGENTEEIDDTEEFTVVDDVKGGKEHDKEEVIEDDVISDNTEEIDRSDDDGGDNNEDGDTEVVAEEEELKDSTSNQNSKAETCENHVKCLMEVLKLLAERSRKEKENGEVDFLETAQRLGYVFPKPRWMSS